VDRHPREALQLNGVNFDGALEEGETLIEAKGPGYAKLFNLGFGDSVISKLLDQAARQVAAAAGKRIIWYFAEDPAATTFTEALAQAGINASKVLVVAAAAP
jgi:hypothetical protein